MKKGRDRYKVGLQHQLENLIKKEKRVAAFPAGKKAKKSPGRAIRSPPARKNKVALTSHKKIVRSKSHIKKTNRKVRVARKDKKIVKRRSVAKKVVQRVSHLSRDQPRAGKLSAPSRRPIKVVVKRQSVPITQKLTNRFHTVHPSKRAVVVAVIVLLVISVGAFGAVFRVNHMGIVDDKFDRIKEGALHVKDQGMAVSDKVVGATLGVVQQVKGIGAATFEEAVYCEEVVDQGNEPGVTGMVHVWKVDRAGEIEWNRFFEEFCSTESFIDYIPAVMDGDVQVWDSAVERAKKETSNRLIELYCLPDIRKGNTLAVNEVQEACAFGKVS